jgi:nitric oxide reductase NorD protein
VNGAALDGWTRLDTGFAEVEAVFEALFADAHARLTARGLDEYLDAAGKIGKLGRGVEPMLAFLEEWPQIACAVGEDALTDVMAVVMRMQRSPNSGAITPFLQTLAAVARRLQTRAQLGHYLDICLDLMGATTISIHGHHSTIASPSLPTFLENAPHLLDRVPIAGVRVWVDYGIRNYLHHPDQQRDYFALKTADSNAVIARQRNGTLFADVERKLDLYLRGLWDDSEYLVPYSTAFHEIRKPIPYYDKLGMRIPDVYKDSRDIPGIERYYATLAHMVGHRRWTESMIADNWSPFQRMAVEFFEDARIDELLCREYPGLRRVFLALHPKPVEGACDPTTMSCLRHRLAMISRAMIDPDHGYSDPLVCEYVDRFHELLADGPASTADIADLALGYITRTRRQSDLLANVWFEDTVIDYRDDNRHMWQFIEPDDEADDFDREPMAEPEKEVDSLPPRHYPEWDYNSQTYRPDWVSVYEGLHRSGNPADIDRLLAKHAALAKRLKRLLDQLKPQEKVRIRYQEEGSELDLDVALRSLIDFRSGHTPDLRINMSHRTDGRNIAVLLLLDLSQSLNEKAAGAGRPATSGGSSDQTILELSQEAVSLLAWAIEQLGDPFAIGGFCSNTRHDVRYLHLKGFSEHFDDDVKARLAAMQAGWSTRLGAAMRHGAHYLSGRKADKKLMLILTDGEPADVDVADERLLIEDAHRAVTELDRDGIFTYCISLDARADEYVSDIFGRRYTVVDNIARLPEKLPRLFMALTK